MEINDLEYKELRLDLVDLTEGVVGSFLFYYDEEVKKKDQKGIMLSERYIQGKFFLEKGAQSAKPRIERACDSWLRDTLREAIGALL